MISSDSSLTGNEAGDIVSFGNPNVLDNTPFNKKSFGDIDRMNKNSITMPGGNGKQVSVGGNIMEDVEGENQEH